MLAAVPNLRQELSRAGVGASEIAAACGISRYRSRFGLWLEKTGRRPPFAGNVHTRLGQLCEPHARQLYATATGYDVEIPPASVFHPEVKWARCTPDGIVLPHDRKHGMQIKCVGYFVGRRFKYEIPIEYEAQVQWEMFVMGWDRIDLAVLVGSDELAWERFVLGDITDPAAVFNASMLEIYTIARSEAAIASLLTKATEFVAMVDEDRQPAIDDSDECAAWLRDKVRPSKVEIDGASVAPLADEFRDAHQREKGATRALKLAKNRVLDAMTAAGANRITTPDGPIDLRIDRNGKVSLHAPKAWGNPEEH